MAGWSGRNKYALLGGMRAVAQMFSFEVPLLLAIVSAVLLAESMSLVKIVEAQRGLWFIFLQPIGFFIYFLCGVAEANRAPFDIPEAESELVAGYHIEYSGIKFSFFFLAEYINMFTVAAIAATLFLGGWRGPFVDQVPALGIFYLLIKAYALIFVMIWFRGTFPRLRIDQLMGLAWKFMLPLALLNVMVTGLVDKLVDKNLSRARWGGALLGGNLVLAAAVIAVVYLVARQRRARGLVPQYKVYLEG
jgi:NADH-quinone oxidoreductase subunit H